MSQEYSNNCSFYKERLATSQALSFTQWLVLLEENWDVYWHLYYSWSLLQKVFAAKATLYNCIDELQDESVWGKALLRLPEPFLQAGFKLVLFSKANRAAQHNVRGSKPSHPGHLMNKENSLSMSVGGTLPMASNMFTTQLDHSGLWKGDSGEVNRSHLSVARISLLCLRVGYHRS